MSYSAYLESVVKQFLYYKTLGEKTFAQLDDEQLFWQASENSNSIAVIVKHLWGNMLSRWTDFLISDGEKEWRKRDEEFEADIQDKMEMMKHWEAAWACLFEALSTLNEENFEQVIYIRNQGHSIQEAINRQLCHYAYHIGQIVFLGRLQKGDSWKSLSIPKDQSARYNAEKFAQAKAHKHFTDEFLDGDKG